jgi:hypothetical protein
VDGVRSSQSIPDIAAKAIEEHIERHNADVFTGVKFLMNRSDGMDARARILQSRVRVRAGVSANAVRRRARSLTSVEHSA